MTKEANPSAKQKNALRTAFALGEQERLARKKEQGELIRQQEEQVLTNEDKA